MHHLPPITLKDYDRHTCQLNKASESCLPSLAPTATRYRRLIYSYRKYLTVSRRNPKTKRYFRSNAAIILEKRRQIYTVPKYVIHPFSEINIYIECLMYFLWMYGYIVDPIFIAFYEIDRLDKPLVWTTVTANVCTSVHMICCFLTGYQIEKTKEIELAPRKIIKHYLKTFFIFDLLSSLPIRTMVSTAHVDMDDIFHNLVSALRLFRLARLVTVQQYFRQITEYFHLNDTVHVIISLCLTTFLFLHWTTCMVYLANKILFFVTGTVNGASWLRRLGISAAQDQVHWYKRYLLCIHTVVMNFYCSGIGMKVSHVFSEHVMLSAIMVMGSIYFVYSLFVTLQLVKSSTTSESKYEEFLYQLNDYMRAKRLPTELRHRIILYYEHRFQKKFFREQAILSSLSEHLKHELFLQSCRHLMRSVSFFHELPKHVVGLILSSLKQEVFLPNDIIQSAHEEICAMYFISYGTVAIYTIHGDECLHLVDGMQFGILHPISCQEREYKYTSVAVEMTECYRWDREDFLRCTGAYQGLEMLIDQITDKITEDIKKAAKEFQEAKRADVVYDLRHQKIIERGVPRK